MTNFVKIKQHFHDILKELKKDDNETYDTGLVRIFFSNYRYSHNAAQNYEEVIRFLINGINIMEKNQ